MTRVAIIGGGIAGVTAAWELTKKTGAQLDNQTDAAPLQTVLFESSNRLGGIVETVREGGFTIECGPDAWVTEKPWARDLAIELGLADVISGKYKATMDEATIPQATPQEA